MTREMDSQGIRGRTACAAKTVLVAVTLAALAGGCGGGGGSPAATAGGAASPSEAGAGATAPGAGGAVEVTLQEWAVVPAAGSAAAGSVTFNATNNGPDDPHELVVVRTDLGHRELPTTEDGSFDEAGDGVAVIGEIEEFPAGETRSTSFDLEAGKYVLLCNLVEEEEGETEAHYQLGMSADFEVR